jgi:hypothetical protein
VARELPSISPIVVKGVGRLYTATNRADGTPEAPKIALLVPLQRIGETEREDPTVIWYANEPIRQPIEVKVIDDRRPEPLAYVRLEQLLEPGYQCFVFADHNVRLSPGDEYEWNVTILGEQQQLFRTRIKRVAPTAGAAGPWYDRIADLIVRWELESNEQRAKDLRDSIDVMMKEGQVPLLQPGSSR